MLPMKYKYVFFLLVGNKKYIEGGGKKVCAKGIAGDCCEAIYTTIQFFFMAHAYLR